MEVESVSIAVRWRESRSFGFGKVCKCSERCVSVFQWGVLWKRFDEGTMWKDCVRIKNGCL